MDDILEYLSNKLSDFDYKNYILPTILLLLFIAGFVYLLTVIKHIEVKSTKETKVVASETSNNDYIYVDVKGSIANPGVYRVKYNARVIDAIKEAGGMLEEANTRFINLSKALNDGDVVMVYSNNEINEAKKDNIVYIETPCVCEEVKNDACYKEETKDGKVNINNASLDELKKLDGIGDAKAKAIIEYRNNNSKFKTIEDIKKVDGISESLYNKIKENITT